MPSIGSGENLRKRKWESMNRDHPKSQINRAKLVLDLCAFELQDVPIWVQAHLEYAIASQIEEAVKESTAQLLATLKTPKKPPPDDQVPLQKVRARTPR